MRDVDVDVLEKEEKTGAQLDKEREQTAKAKNKGLDGKCGKAKRWLGWNFLIRPRTSPASFVSHFVSSHHHNNVILHPTLRNCGHSHFCFVRILCAVDNYTGTREASLRDLRAHSTSTCAINRQRVSMSVSDSRDVFTTRQLRMLLLWDRTP